MKPLRLIATLAAFVCLGGCNVVLLSPAGDVAVQQRNLLLASTGLMLLIILPVMALTIGFAWHYRATNKAAHYDPHWHHSTALEVVIWTAPLLIIIALGALTWMGTHLLDPYRSVGRITAGRPIAANTKPLTVEVVALDWKWLFVYPELGIATVNEMAAPVDVPLSFKLTSGAVFNTFSVPALAGMIYTMPGMETKLNAVINKVGVYDGQSAHYSGAGFSKMRFKFHGLDQAGFDAWVAKVKGANAALDPAVYSELEKPSEGDAPRYFSSVDGELFAKILNMCTDPGKMCAHEMMAIDAAGGAGRDSEANRERLIYDGARTREGHEAPGATFPASGRTPRSSQQPEGMNPRGIAPDVHGGHGGTHPSHGGAPTTPGGNAPASNGDTAPAQIKN